MPQLALCRFACDGLSDVVRHLDFKRPGGPGKAPGIRDLPVCSHHALPYRPDPDILPGNFVKDRLYEGNEI
ncbi:hypothetical protein [Cupriavidus basilensis]|uniref:hypothetical protein n=1 Tax=Cupriavidus basilensis TaxID=68895 RepID=UPI0002FD083B|nr:hypothetical protein [Cupriavidus basilensis]